MKNQSHKMLNYAILSFVIATVTIMHPTGEIHAQQPISIKIDKGFSNSQVIFPFDKTERIYRLEISGSIQLYEDNSLIRVILVGDDFHEYLVYEAYPLIVDNNSVKIINECEETCITEGIAPHSLKIELIDASLQIDEMALTDYPQSLKMEPAEAQKQMKEEQDADKIKKLNENIKKKGQKWIAGETSVSKLSYEEKKKLFGKDKVPNLQGAEYYKGGIFEIKSKVKSQSFTGEGVSALIESFDWRNRHGADNPGSPYYDGDPTGSGWITSVKHQGPYPTCWPFSGTGATEALVNLYFNQHLDLDLAEQDVISCRGDGGTINFFSTTGVVDEACFPYSGMEEPCENKCSNPDELIQLSGHVDFEDPKTEEKLKRMIIDYGPLSGGIYSWNHAMPLVGYDKDQGDGETIWIFKNSYGSSWGDNGYGYIKTDINNIGWTNAFLTPVESWITPYEIQCYDKDRDGYYNWGISDTKPDTCPAHCSDEKDCDDYNPSLGPFDANGHCLEVCALDSKFKETSITVGERYYADRSYTITGGVPSWMVGRTLVQTPNDERFNNAASGYLRFKTPVSWWVYVLFDSRASSKPDWLNGWEHKSKYKIYTSLKPQPYLEVWRKYFNAGECVNLGGNFGPGSSDENRSNFVVVYGKNCVLDSKFKKTTVDVDKHYYADRSYTIAGGVPSWMVGRTLIKTPNDERFNNVASGYLRFKTPVSWWVYVLFDSRASSLPDWLNGWEHRSQYKISTSLKSQPYLEVWRKYFCAGQCVNLGGNFGPGSSDENRSNFVVVYGK